MGDGGGILGRGGSGVRCGVCRGATERAWRGAVGGSCRGASGGCRVRGGASGMACGSSAGRGVEVHQERAFRDGGVAAGG